MLQALQLAVLQAHGNVVTHGGVAPRNVAIRVVAICSTANRVVASSWRRYYSVGGQRCSVAMVGGTTKFFVFY
jgi:hypothetical protein